MAALSTVNPTLADVAKRMDPDGKIDTIVEILNLTNEILQDATFVEGNLPTGHRTTIRTGIPTPTWRKLYGGVQPTKSTTAQVTDNCGMLEAYAEVDKALADLNGNAASFRLSEDRAHLEGMNQEFASTLFYGNEGTEPEAFTGLSPRFNALSGAASADNVISASGSSSDNASVWLIVWSPETVHCIYPKGSSAGWKMTDKGQVTVEDASGGSNTGRMEAYRTHYRWDLGLTVKDWRFAVRICNIDKSDLLKDAASGADLIDLMTQALELVPSLAMGRPVFYCSRHVRSFLRRQMTHRVKQSTLTFDMVAGQRVLALDGVPVRRCDALAANEDAVA
jgi:hypothetical protein